MEKSVRSILGIINTLLVFAAANCTVLIAEIGAMWYIPFAAAIFIFANIMPLIGVSGERMAACRHGASTLKIFLASATMSIVYHITAAFFMFPEKWKLWLLSAAICTVAEAILFWNGMICVYCSSVQLGIKLRVLGALFGMVPVVNLFFLVKIIKTVTAEADFEAKRDEMDRLRREKRICATKYPILLVHGVFFRDSRYLNYWGRIPAALEANGAVIYYGNQPSAASVDQCGKYLAERIKTIVSETGCEKVNVIAHSKGGLDIRCAMSRHGAAEYIDSVTTVNTPHRGCEFADYLLNKLPRAMQDKVAAAYNGTLKRLGEPGADFMSAVSDLTASACAEYDKEFAAPEGVICQSIGSKLKRAQSGKFPLNFTYHLVKYFDGANDGLVSEKSFKWGDRYIFVEAPGTRGISHGDMIDLNRENIPGFDVREFYVTLAAELKQRGC